MAPTVIPSGGRFIAAHEKSADVTVRREIIQELLEGLFLRSVGGSRDCTEDR